MKVEGDRDQQEDEGTMVEMWHEYDEHILYTCMKIP